MFEGKKKVWIAGANGGLGLALTEHILAQGHLVTVSTRHTSQALLQLQASHSTQMTCVLGDLCQQRSNTQSQLMAIFEQYGLPDWTINAAGLLHAPQSKQSPKAKMPEKRLSQITESFLVDNIHANAYTNVAIAQLLDTLYKRKDPFHFLCLSAMVGSISDNDSGGWYSYRMSKAALNMFVKTLSIEWQRRFPQACIAAIHPGTTNTSLSAPFQHNINSDKLYSPQLSAERIYRVLSTLTPADTGQFFHWDGTTLPW
ncbi:SDR family NAD(P)-dependent oxidoreductase [Photobacterium sp. DNB23_23_1]